MRLFGLELSIGRKSAGDVSHWVEEAGGWWPVIREGYAGAWQQNITIRRETLYAYTPLFACIQRITTDIGKMPIRLMQKNGKIWVVATDKTSTYYKVIKKPNDYQNQSQFLVQWMISKLLAGNTYGLKLRDQRQNVVKVFLLDPTRVRPLITPLGEIWYECGYDPLSEVYESIMVPASEIIHDRMPGLFHPLVGTSPIFACALPAAQGHAMQRSSAAFFKNMAQPSGILTAPGPIADATARRLREVWEDKFTGGNVGKVAVLGDGLKFEPVTVSAAAAQAVEQLKLSGEQVCMAFNVPAFMVGVAPAPAMNNIESMTQQYWSQCLQFHIEGIECGLSEGIGLDNPQLPVEMCTRLDLDALLKMDTTGRYNAYKTGISGAFMTPNEARMKENFVAVEGGDTVYMQQQNYSLAALAKRDSESPAPPSPGAGGTTQDKPSLPAPSDSEDDGDKQETDSEDEAQAAKALAFMLAKGYVVESASPEPECTENEP
jgi:HK97 family phage portal protein